MSITDYASLKTTVISYLHRTDLSDSVISDFVSFGELQLNRKLRLLEMETEATLSLTAGNNSVSLPTGFLEPIDLYYDSDKSRLANQNLMDLNSSRDYDTTTAQPRYYTISGGVIKFECLADNTYSLKLDYFKKWDIAVDDTNWLLENAPDLYLYASLLQAKAFVKNPADISLWSQIVKSTLTDLNRLDGRTRGKRTVRLDSAITSAGRFDIQRGY